MSNTSKSDSPRHSRTEHDLLGNKEVPAAAYYGIETVRALENFHITGVPIRQYPELIQALAMVKLATARANYDVGEFTTPVVTFAGNKLELNMDGSAGGWFVNEWGPEYAYTFTVTQPQLVTITVDNYNDDLDIYIIKEFLG